MSPISAHDLTDISEVAEEVRRRWGAVGIEAQVVDWSLVADSYPLEAAGVREAVIAAGANAIECILDHYDNWDAIRRSVEWFVEGGWSVTILTPLSKMGCAHDGLRGATAGIQGWWQSDVGTMFTAIETA